MSQPAPKHHLISTEAAIALLLRVGIGILFLFAGLNKFMREGGAVGVAESMIDRFADTVLPGFLVTPFVYALPYVEVTLGVFLILGLFTRSALLFTGLLLLSLALGLLASGGNDTVPKVLNYLLITCVALWFASRDNAYSLDTLRRKI
jgi:thiosulfate dehydrogenase [quinone] large subunit